MANDFTHQTSFEHKLATPETFLHQKPLHNRPLQKKRLHQKPCAPKQMMQILKRGFTLTQGGYPLWGERCCCKKRVYFEEESFLYLRSGSWNKYKVKRLWYICMVTPPRTPRQRKSSANCLLKRISSANCLLKNIYHNTYLLDNPSHNASDLQIAFPNKSKKPEQKKTKQKEQRKLTHQRPRNQNQNQKKQNQKKTKPKKNKENWLIRDPQTKTKQVYKTESYRYTKQSRIVIPSVIKQTGPGPSF